MAGQYLPSLPTPGGANLNVDVWNGTSPGGNPAGSGELTEFCIHKDHPYVKSLGTLTSFNLSIFRPTYTTKGAVYSEDNVLAKSAIFTEINQKYLPFSHAIHFNTAVENRANEFNTPHYAQAEFNAVESPYIVDETSKIPNVFAPLSTFPIKLGFSAGDEFLIGKKTCGAYLFMLPQSHASISVDGTHPNLAKREVKAGSGAAITIPVIFQFRSLDKLGTVIGGWRSDGLKPTNVTYEKIIGIDIYAKNQPFSFDLRVSGKHQRDTVITSSTVFTPNTGGGVNVADLTDILKNSVFNLRGR
jgi:hypothetical protein